MINVVITPLQTSQQPVPAYVYSVTEKIHYASVSLRMRTKPAENLIAGPFAGEFGWELMQWQSYVRWVRANYRETHVITYPGRDYLYEGCAVHCHDIQLPKAGYGYGLLSPGDSRGMALAKAQEIGLTNFDVFYPALICTQYHKRFFWKQDFRLFEEKPLGQWDIAFHFRRIEKVGPDDKKNYATQSADTVADLCSRMGLSMICIGHPEYSYCAKGCADYRRVNLQETVAAMSSVRAVAGENSGPMHLANLCGRPTIVWARNQAFIDVNFAWNPFRVPIYVAANTHQPDPQRVAETIRDALGDLRKKTADFTQPAYTLPAQQIAYF